LPDVTSISGISKGIANSNTEVPCPRGGDNPEIEDAIQILWRRHLIWKMASHQQWMQIRRNRLAVLNLTVAGAALQTVANRFPPSIGWVASIAGGGCVGLVPYLTSKYLGSDKTDAKKRSYAAARAIEAEVYQFRAGVAPYDGRDGSDPVDKLVEYCSNVSDDVKDLNGMYVMAGEPDDSMPAPPPRLDKRSYIDTRVKFETEHYKKKARHNIKRVELCRSCHSVASLTSGAIGLIAGGFADGISAQIPNNLGNIFKNQMAPWGAVATTASAAIAAHIAASNFDERSSTFLAKAKRLENLVLCLDRDVEPGSPGWDQFVNDCEITIAGDINKWDAVQTR